MRSTPPCRVDELTAQELQAPWSCTSTTPVATSADNSARSPPSCWTAGRINSMMAVSAASRSPRSSSVRSAGAPGAAAVSFSGSIWASFVSTSSFLLPVGSPGTSGPAAPLPHSLPCRASPPCTASTAVHPGGTARGGTGLPCDMAPVRPSEPVGAVGLILPTFVQDTVPAWAEVPADTAPEADPLVELADLCRRAEDAGAGALWACDHLFWHGPCLESLVVLTVAATATTRSLLGTCVIQLPLRRAVAVAKPVSYTHLRAHETVLDL